MFVKPHANTEATRALVRSTLEARKIAIVAEGEIDAAAIDEDKLIDQHYYAIASKATLTKPKDLPVPADAFQAKYGVSWQSALDDGKVFNALDACAHFGVDSAGLDAKWQKAKKDGLLVKFGGGFYCGKVEDIYVFNGFFMEMRAAFVAPGASIHYYVVEFEPADCKWAAFRGDVLGPTDPADAPETLPPRHDLPRLEAARPEVQAVRGRERRARVRVAAGGARGETGSHTTAFAM